MANREALEVIRQGASVWNRWKMDKAPGFGGDLTGADLQGMDFTSIDLAHTDLKRANLAKANLTDSFPTWADFTEADLSRASLSNADLTGAKLVRTILTGADLGFTNFAGADLNAAVLTEAELRETILGDTNLRQVEGLDTCYHRGPSTVDHRTIAKSGPLPLSFLRGCGLPDKLIDYLPSLLNDALQFYSCFISYSHNDKAFTRRLFDTLQGRGIRCWLDEKQLRPGDDIYEEVDRGVRLWDKVLLCCSKDSLTSWWVDNEIGKHSRRNRPS